MILETWDDEIRWCDQRLAEPHVSTAFASMRAHAVYQKTGDESHLDDVNPEDWPLLGYEA